jgi:hypothetical protein
MKEISKLNEISIEDDLNFSVEEHARRSSRPVWQVVWINLFLGIAWTAQTKQTKSGSGNFRKRLNHALNEEAFNMADF